MYEHEPLPYKGMFSFHPILSYPILSYPILVSDHFAVLFCCIYNTVLTFLVHIIEDVPFRSITQCVNIILVKFQHLCTGI